MPPDFYSSIDQFREKAGYEVNGCWYPRVTAILNAKAKPGLYHYYSRHRNYATARRSLDKAAKEGQRIHDAIEAVLRGEGTVNESARPIAEAFAAFLNEHAVHPELIEECIWSDEHRYAGTMDVFATLDGEPGIVDIKTSTAVYPEHYIQTAAYAQAMREHGYDVRRRWILRADQVRPCLMCGARLRSKGGNRTVRGGEKACDHQWGPMRGETELVEMDSPLEDDIAAFLACKRLWEWEYGNWLKKLLQP